MQVGVNNRNAMTIRKNGNVGIDVNSPQAALHLNTQLTVNTPTDDGHLATRAYVDAQSLGTEKWTTSGTTTYYTNPVAIGTTSVDSGITLQVDGKVKSTDTLLASNIDTETNNSIRLASTAATSMTGNNNIAIGYQSLNSATSASNTTAIGYQAGYSTNTNNG